MEKIAKAIEIRNAKIRFVSLVDKAANLQRFLVTKSKDGGADFTTFGQIVKTDSENHYVTGIVYEPMVKDSQGNFMTEDEIIKAARWYAKNGNMVDVQHSFKPLDSANVVESWVAKADFKLGEKSVKKGTWLMTVEITDDNIWKSIEKGEITGFSMGGMGEYSTEDVDIEHLEKSFDDATPKKRRGIIKTLLSLLDGEKDIEKQEEKEVAEVTKDEMKAIVSEAIEKSTCTIVAEVAKIIKEDSAPENNAECKGKESKESEPEDTKNKKELALSKEEITEMISEAVKEALPDMLTKALEPVYAQRGYQQSGNDEVSKSEGGSQKHYLAGII